MVKNGHYYLLHWEAGINIMSRIISRIWFREAAPGWATEQSSALQATKEVPRPFSWHRLTWTQVIWRKAKGGRHRATSGNGRQAEEQGAQSTFMELLQKVSRLDRRLQSPPGNNPPGEVCSTQGTLLYLGHGCCCVTRGLETSVAWFLILYMIHPMLEGTLCSRLCFGAFLFLVSLADF